MAEAAHSLVAPDFLTLTLSILEFNQSIFVAVAEGSGAVQTRAVVLIPRLLLALGGLYWLIADWYRRRANATPQESRSAPPEQLK